MNLFDGWLAEVSSDSLLVDESEDGLQREAQSNFGSFSITPAQAQVLTEADIIRFLDAVVEIRRRQIRQMPDGPHSMTFYCWHDEQADQLRFSLVSISHGGLPFSTRVEECEDVGKIVERFLSSSYHAGIAISEFVPQQNWIGQGANMEAPATLEVWTNRLP